MSVFESQLFDIYLSYSQKTTTVISSISLPKTTIAPSVMSSVHLGHMNDMPFDPMHMVMPIANMALPSQQPPHVLMQSLPVVGKDHHSSETQVVVNNGNTIYDSELQLLTDCTDQSVQKVVEEYPTFKHGSFLLYPQRGLLETLPLVCTCVRVSGNATIKEASVRTVRKPASETTTTSSVAITPVTKTSGYNFPTLSGGSCPDKAAVDVSTSQEQRGSMTRLPSSVSNISVSPKELMMHIDSIKSGASYSVTLELGSCEVALTDLCIQSSNVMSSVCVEVWSCDECDAVRVAHSSELAHKSLSLGNLSPPPICRFVKVRK